MIKLFHDNTLVCHDIGNAVFEFLVNEKILLASNIIDGRVSQPFW